MGQTAYIRHQGGPPRESVFFLPSPDSDTLDRPETMSRFLRVTPRLPVADLNRTMDFYRNRLGFSAAVVWPQDKPVFCILDRDQTSLGFYVPEAGQDAGLPGAGEFYIDVEDVAGLHRQLESSVTVEWGPEVYFYGRREFAVRDPDGYLVIFTEKTDDPPTCLDQ